MSDDFWDAAAPLLGEGVLEEGTIMGGACVRSGGSGEGASFVPAGKVFKEWVLVESHDEDRWTELLRESVAFVNP